MSAHPKLIAVRPRGRPSLYNPAYCDRVLVPAAEGCGKAEIAADLGVSSKTLNAWIKLHREFKDAMNHAKDLEYAWWLQAGRKGQFDKTWNATSWALQMRNRFGKRFWDRTPPLRAGEPKDTVNAEKLRDEMGRKLSRIADAGAENVVSCGIDAARVENPKL